MKKYFKTVLIHWIVGEIVALIFLSVSVFNLQTFIAVNVGILIGFVLGLTFVLAIEFREFDERWAENQKQFEREQQRQLQQYQRIKQYFEEQQ
jgi:uncharacterized membrane protein YccC